MSNRQLEGYQSTMLLVLFTRAHVWLPGQVDEPLTLRNRPPSRFAAA